MSLAGYHSVHNHSLPTTNSRPNRWGKSGAKMRKERYEQNYRQETGVVDRC